MGDLPLIDVLQKIFAIGASITVIIGGIQAVRGFSLRLEPNVSGEVLRKGALHYVLVTLELKNIGIRRVYLAHDNPSTSLSLTTLRTAELPKGSRSLSLTTLRTAELPKGSNTIPEPRFGKGAYWPAFEHHQYLQPGETLSERRVIPFPTDKEVFALQIDLYVHDAHRRGRRGYWEAKQFVSIENK